MQTKSGSTVKANYSYLSDGAKASVLNASGTGYDYNGTFTYSHASGGTRTLESVAFGGGRIRKNGSTYAVDYYVTDHLGSVRAIVNASGAIVEQNDYYPFGTRQQNGLTPLSTNRWRFSGKEGYDSTFGIALDDFGARLFDRTAWTSIDPLAEKYYSVSPYMYCAGNPVRFVDLDGERIWKVDNNGDITKAWPSIRTVIKTVDERGNTISKIRLNNAKITSDRINVNGNRYDYFVSNDDAITKQLFEFIATPSNWGFPDNGSDNGVINESSVMYTNMGNAVLLGENKAVPTANLAIAFINKGAVFSRIDHVHPGDNPDPSGVEDKSADIGTIITLKNHGIKFSTKEGEQYHIFWPTDKQYYPYDEFFMPSIPPATLIDYKK